MTSEPPAYNQLYIQAWTLLSIAFCVVFFGMLVFGPHLLNFGHWIWDLLRYLASPLI